MNRSGTAMAEYKHDDSLYRFAQASHEESMPLRRRHVPLPPSGQQSYHATTSSNLLLGSQSAMQSSTSSLAQTNASKSKKKLSHKRGSVGKGSQGVVVLTQTSSSARGHNQSSKDHKTPLSHYTSTSKENSGVTNNTKHGSSSHRVSEKTPAGPSSTHPVKNQLPKS